METPKGFEMEFIFLAYVPPYNEEDQPYSIKTETISRVSKRTEYLFKIFDSSKEEAKIEIMFNSDDEQNNPVRNDILQIAQEIDKGKKSYHAKKLSKKLYLQTDGRNGTGLFIVMQGKKDNLTRMVLLRFKGVEALVNNKRKDAIVDYMSEVFTKRSQHYKLSVYEDILSDAAFWKGLSVDKQLSSPTYKPISLFWVEQFLESHTALTDKMGTLQFTKALKTILQDTTDVDEQEQIISGLLNLRSKKDPKTSLASFCKDYLSEPFAERIKEKYEDDAFYNSVFKVDRESYNKLLGKTVVRMMSGVTAYIPTFKYSDSVTEVEMEDGSKEIIIKGKLESKKLQIQQDERKPRDKYKP